MEEALPPVTRAMTFWMLAGPVKAADSPVARLNWPKLWKRLLPTVRPTVSGMV